MRRLVLLLSLLVVAGCGSDSNSASTQTTPQPQERSTPTAPASDQAPNVKAAEDAARTDLPDIPLWEGTQFRGAATSDTGVCVNRILKKSSAALVGGARTSHVVVTWPGLAVGEAKDGPCAKAQENEDQAIVAARRFYLRMDNEALALEEAVKAAQNGETDAVSRLSRLRSRTRDRVNAYLLSGGDTSVGGNLLLSAATTAREAAESGDVARLADMRREIADARNKLADEAIK